MGIGNNIDFIEKMQRHAKEAQATRNEKLFEIKKEEILERHKLSSPAYMRKNEEKQKEMRAIAYTHKLKRWMI